MKMVLVIAVAVIGSLLSNPALAGNKKFNHKKPYNAGLPARMADPALPSPVSKWSVDDESGPPKSFNSGTGNGGIRLGNDPNFGRTRQYDYRLNRN
ncbi:hypothetical protein [Labrys neptuniae]|uniref:Uncharacterized protein n=1 Tax=Labrys neptuniae TaxID=376174 RepID=A0ABV3PWE9_9HYPH